MSDFASFRAQSEPSPLAPDELAQAIATLGTYLAGEFENQAQAQADPVWYVHLRLWQRPVSWATAQWGDPHAPDELRSVPSRTLFLEQASIVNLDHPYRPRLARLYACNDAIAPLRMQYYMFQDLDAVRGLGRDRTQPNPIHRSDIQLLPGCLLHIQIQPNGTYSARLPDDARCCFTYAGEIRQVSLGFDATPEQFLSYDKGIDPATGRALWGAMMGPFQFHKITDYSHEWPS
jgi:hypothetical protein